MMKLRWADAEKYERQVDRLFLTAFPREERPPLWLMKRRCRQGKAQFSAILDGDRFVGLTYVVGSPCVETLMFFAIAEDARDKGYGTEILKMVHEKYRDYKFFLNIEVLDENAPNYEQRCRRKEFYNRNGLGLLDYQVREMGVTYEMLTYGEYITRPEYEEAMEAMYGRILYNWLVKRM